MLSYYYRQAALTVPGFISRHYGFVTLRGYTPTSGRWGDVSVVMHSIIRSFVTHSSVTPDLKVQPTPEAQSQNQNLEGRYRRDRTVTLVFRIAYVVQLRRIIIRFHPIGVGP
jgi:hypothetical protein